MPRERLVWLLTCPYTYPLYIVDMLFKNGVLYQLHVAHAMMCRGCDRAGGIPEGGYGLALELKEGVIEETVYTDWGIIDETDEIDAWFTLLAKELGTCILLAETRIVGDEAYPHRSTMLLTPRY